MAIITKVLKGQLAGITGIFLKIPINATRYKSSQDFVRNKTFGGDFVEAPFLTVLFWQK